MSHIFPRHSKTQVPKAVRGEGCYLFNEAGKAYLDGSGGAAVSCLGHGDPDVIAAVQEQAAKLSYAHTSFFTNEPTEQLADLLIQHSPGDLDRVYLFRVDLKPLRLPSNWHVKIFVKLTNPNVDTLLRGVSHTTAIRSVR